MTKFTIEGTSSGQGQGSISIKPNPGNDPKSTHRGIIKLYQVTKNSNVGSVKTLKRTINLVQKAKSSTVQEQYYLNLNIAGNQDYQASSLGIKDIAATYTGSSEATVLLYVQCYKISSEGQTELPVVVNFTSEIDDKGNGIKLENEDSLSNTSLHTRKIQLNLTEENLGVTHTAKLVLTLPAGNLKITLDASLVLF